MRQFSDKTIAKVRRAKSKLKRKLKRMPGIVGVGIGYRERRGKLLNSCAIRVYVRRKFADSVLPRSQTLPKSVDGVPVDVIEEDVFPESNGSPTSRHSPLIGGVMIANQSIFPEIGTLGCRLRDRITGDHYILSNWHVLYGLTDALDDEPIVQPRPHGNGNVVAHTVAGVISDRVDCALAVVDGLGSIDPGVLGLTTEITGFGKPRLGMKVVSSGVTRVAKKGVIDDIELEREIPFPDHPRTFVKQLRIRPRANSPTTRKGDSGSVWLAEDSGEVVGLHFAGASGAAVASPISAVIRALRTEGFRLEL